MIVGIHFQLEIDANAWRARMDNVALDAADIRAQVKALVEEGVVADLEREGLLVAGWAELRRST